MILRLILFCSAYVFMKYVDGQPVKEGSLWYFGFNAGVDFRTEPPTILNDGQIWSFFARPCTISDENGDLLFYSDGSTAWNKHHQVMPNGTNLTIGLNFLTMPTVIVPDPGDNDLYYLFSANSWNGQALSGLHYAIVDMSADGGNGDIIQKNIDLKNPTTELLSVVNHADDKSFWVMGHEWRTDKFYAYHITDTGIEGPVISQIGAVYSFFPDDLFPESMCFSPDGTMLAVAAGGKIQLFDFNSNTGILSNVRTIEIPGVGFNGVAFSPNSILMYASVTNGIFQMDVSSGDLTEIKDSAIIVGTVSRNILTDLQLAYNGQIYCARGGGDCCQDVIAIRNPNVKGLGCNFVSNGLAIPNDAVYGLPTAVQSFFRDPPAITAQETCVTQSATLTVTSIGYCDSLRFDFGDGQSVMDKIPVSKTFQHKYDQPGTYTLTLIRYVGNVQRVVNGSVEIKDIVLIDIGKDSTLCEGQSLTLSAGLFDQYLWSTGQTSTSITVTTPNTYWINVMDGPCMGRDTITVNFLKYPVISLPAKTVTCEEEYTISVPNNPLYQYQWSTGETSNQIEVSADGQYSVVISNGHCSTARNTELVFKNIQGFGLPENYYLIVDSVKANITFEAIGTNVSLWEWTFGDGDKAETTIGEVQHQYLPGSYRGKVIGRNDAECFAEFEFLVEVPLILFVPNVITPNGDNKNEKFRIIYNGDNSAYQLIIFNRWGDKIFATSDITNHWMATDNAAGIYYYALNINGQKMKGWVHVIK